MVEVNFKARKIINQKQKQIEFLQEQIEILQQDIDILKNIKATTFSLADGGTGYVTHSGDLIIARDGYFTNLGYFMKKYHNMSLTPFYEFVYTETGIPELLSTDPEPKDLKHFATKLANLFAKTTGYTTPDGQKDNGLYSDFNEDYERLKEANKDIEQAGFSILM